MKKQKQFEVKIYSSGYSTYKIKAEDGHSAIIKARKMPVNHEEILSNLENWRFADEVEEINNKV